jgi:hypothetical protein
MRAHDDQLDRDDRRVVAAQEASPMFAKTHSISTPRRGGRRRLSVGLLVAALAGAAFGGYTRIASPASAAIKQCPDGGPPPCLIETSTTVAPPPTWFTHLVLLVKDPGNLTGSVSADRFWLTPIVVSGGTTTVGSAQARVAARTSGADASVSASPSATVHMIPLPSVVTPAGTAPLANNGFAFPATPPPAGATMALRVREAGSPGALCRTWPVTQPASGVQLHLLVPAAQTENATDLNAMVGGLVGPVAGMPSGVTMNIIHAFLTPQTNGLMLNLQGTLVVGSWQFLFDLKLRLVLVPDTSTNTNSVFQVQAPDPATVNLGWISPQPSNGNDIKTLVAAMLAGQMRTKVLGQAPALVNGAITGLHDIQWWAEQGFTLSVRRVEYTTSALTVYPGLCRLG